MRAALEKVPDDSIGLWPFDEKLSEDPGITCKGITRVEAVGAIEQEFGILLAEMTPEDLASISTLADLVVRARRSERRD